MTTATRRLPGFSFEDHTPVRDVLPRMDIALFAGFARRGPVNIPVAIEDTAQFEAIFGGVTPLALDLDTRQEIVAQLAPAVRLFFANGGRRCWVIRLAGAAATNTFRVPGVVARRSSDAPGLLQPFELRARSGGSWSDDVTVSASVSSRRYAAVSCDVATAVLELVGVPSAPLNAGDLLRLRWEAYGIEAYVGVVDRVVSDVDGRVVVSWRTRTTEVAEFFDLDRNPQQQVGTATLVNGSTVPAEFEPGFGSPSDPDLESTLLLHVARTDAPRRGEILEVAFGRDVLQFAIRDAVEERREGSPRATVMRLTGRTRWQRTTPFNPGLDLPLVERLTLDVWTREGAAQARLLEGAGLAPRHPRHLGRLSNDRTLFGPPEPAPESAGDDLDDQPPAWWHDAAAAQFPLAGSGDAPLCVPFGVTALPEFYLAANVPAGPALERDGLDPFNADLFVDASLAGSLAATIAADAEFIRYLRTPPRLLRGLHPVLDIEEVSLIAVPDAAQPGWSLMEYSAPLPPNPSDPIAKDTCPVDDFIDCGSIVGRKPLLKGRLGAANHSIDLEWSADEMDTTFIVEESTSRDWRGATPVFEGRDFQATLHARQPADYYYRVRGIGDHPTEWSDGVGVQVQPGAGFRVTPRSRYQDDVLLAVHRALLRLCASRRDLMAVLSLPAHYRRSQLATHVERLTSVRPEPANRTSVRDEVMVPPLSLGEADALSFGAIYHGWMYSRDNGALALVCPDGAACGVLARRAIQRGAWVAPANEPLRGIVALHHPEPADAWAALQDLQTNVTRAHANGFLMLSADTLARDPDVRPINVRRLLMLLRRMAARLGADFVFEPNDASFRRMVQRRFEAMLGEMFERGAFAGDTAQSAFQVVTGESLNTRQAFDLGRFICELRVAPSRPLSFLTLRLVQTGERLSVTGA